MLNRKEHWEKVYSSKSATELTWFQEKPEVSLSLIGDAELPLEAPILDVGGGTSRFSSFLVHGGYRDVSVLDVSGSALEIAKGQLGERAGEVQWIEADLLEFEPTRRWQLWHDRAVFHFLTLADDREAYRRGLLRGLEGGGHLIIATFAIDGPTRCSGLDCVQYGPESLGDFLGKEFELRGSVSEAHPTPSGGSQDFVYSWFQRSGE
jgi:SAM-dependent methyltransferase